MKKTISILLSLIMVLSVFTVIPVVTAGALYSVSYIDADGIRQTVEDYESLDTDYENLTLSNGWYVVEWFSTVESRIICEGDVHLILCDDTFMQAHDGITVNEGSSLTVYGQTKSNGKLSVRHTNVDSEDPDYNYCSAIGGTKEHNSGTITINGGDIDVVNGSTQYGAAIGGGYTGGGHVFINGGAVSASCTCEQNNAAVIGGGGYCIYPGTSTEVVINGGVVTADNNNINGTAIGGGIYDPADVTINGGTVSAVCSNENSIGAAIGSGKLDHCDVTVNGGKVTATSEGKGAGIGVSAGKGLAGFIHINGGVISASSIGGGTGTEDPVDDIDIYLRYTNEDDSIFANAYIGDVYIGGLYVGNTYYAGDLLDNNEINNQILTPTNDSYSYIDANGEKQVRSTYTIVDEDTTSLSAGWYLVAKDTTISSRITCSGDVHLVLRDDRQLTAPKGITVNEGNSLTIYGQRKGTGTLKIEYLRSDANAANEIRYAAIGGTYSNNKGNNSGTIKINSGTVDVKIKQDNDNTTLSGAAIGGANNASGTVIINGGAVSASTESSTSSYPSGTAIGGGSGSNGAGYVTINGGTVTASTVGSGAAIGGGDSANSTGSYVTINGGTVTATCSRSGSLGAAIGGSSNRSGTVTINGGKVTAAVGAENSGAAIGGGSLGIGTVTITGGEVTANGGYSSSAIGGGSNRKGIVTISGGTVTATCGQNSQGAAIGGGYGTNSNTYDTEVTITGGDITAISEGTGFGIGGGYSRNATVTVSGGSITASSIGGTNSDEHPSVISLSWKDLTDTILADSYLGTVTLQKSFKIGTTNGYIGLIEDNSILNGNVLSISKFIGHSLTLSGDIGLNFYINLTMEEVMQGVSLNFSWDVEGEEQTDSVTLSAANKTDNGYKISVSVPVAEMTYDVTATLYVGGEFCEINVYSVKRYSETVLSDDFRTDYLEGHTEDQYNKLVTLVKAMLDYGAKAQVEFDRDIFNLANSDFYYKMPKVTAGMIPSTASDMNEGLDEYGLSYSGTTIVYLTKTSMRHYYTVTDSTKFNAVKDSITFDGVKVDPVEKSGRIYFELTDIAAADLDTPCTLHIGNNDYDYAVLDYVRECLSSANAPVTTKLLVSATYWYNQAANDYFGR